MKKRSTPPSQQPGTDELIDRVAATLRSKGERMTEPRRAVLIALATTEGHLTMEEVVAEVARFAPQVHRTSVYRALVALSDLGVVQHVHSSHSATAYHLTDESGGHLHAQCRECGRIFDLPGDLLTEVAIRMGVLEGFELDATHIALSGRCHDCRALPDDGDHPASHHSPTATRLH